ncbi:MAG TPA: hypothetical protein VGQ42_07695 [Candidatus Dormibacteraeota bacterium]|nr:hypothetical protein [Candidatus Dormibacteraeota bacterium]
MADDDTPTVPLETVPLDRPTAPAPSVSSADGGPSAPRWEEVLHRERSQHRSRAVALVVVIVSVAIVLVALRLMLG